MIPDTDNQSENQRLLAEAGAMPIGQAMAVPGPPLASFRPNSTQPAAMPVAGNRPATPSSPIVSAASPASAPPPMQSATAKLWQAADKIQNPFEKALAKIGAGALRALDVGAESVFPREAQFIPGSETQTSIRNAAARKNAQTQQAMQIEQEKADTERRAMEQKPELAELTGEQKGRLEAEKEASQEKRLQETIQGKKDVTQAQILGRQDIAKMEDDNKLALAAGKPAPHITILGDDNRAHIMERDPQTGKYSIDRGVAPPTYGQIAPSLKTIDVLDPDTGLPTVETLGGQKLGVSATGAFGHEAAQAGAVQRAGTDLISDIKANKDKLGQISTWVEKYGLNTPIADPTLAKLQAELGTFAALQPAMHGFRGGNALDTFEKIIGGLQKNPDATIASIEGILKTSSEITGQSRNKPAGGGNSGGTPWVQKNSKGDYRYSTDGGKTWQQGKPPQ